MSIVTADQVDFDGEVFSHAHEHDNEWRFEYIGGHERKLSIGTSSGAEYDDSQTAESQCAGLIAHANSPSSRVYRYARLVVWRGLHPTGVAQVDQTPSPRRSSAVSRVFSSLFVPSDAQLNRIDDLTLEIHSSRVGDTVVMLRQDGEFVEIQVHANCAGLSLPREVRLITDMGGMHAGGPSGGEERNLESLIDPAAFCGAIRDELDVLADLGEGRCLLSRIKSEPFVVRKTADGWLAEKSEVTDVEGLITVGTEKLPIMSLIDEGNACLELLPVLSLFA